MSDYTRTTNYSLYKPVPGEDDDVWGDHWNANADTLDDVIRKIDVRGSGGGVLLVTDFLPPGQPDGVTDNTPYLQDALDAAAGVTDTAHRELAPGTSTLVVPAAAAPYIVGCLVVPSNSHLIIEPGATIKLANMAHLLISAPGYPATGRNDNTLLFLMAGTTNVLVELYGTLDGNVVNQLPASTVGIPGAWGIASSGLGSVSNIFILGNRTGQIINVKMSPFALCCTNGEVRGVTFSDCGNSVGFNGLTTKTTVAATGNAYTSATGATVLTTTIAHNINPGDTFAFTATAPFDINFSYLLGEYVAAAGTSGTMVNFTGPAGLGAMAFPTTASVGTCTKSYNVGVVDCIAEDIQDLGLVLYGGVVGGYIRGCEVRGCSGPTIFSDNAQPGSNIDCEISDCYSHHNQGAGPGIASNAFGIVAHNSRIRNNVSCYNMGGGMNIAAAVGVEVHGNLLHNNMPALPGITNSIYHDFSSHLRLAGVDRVNVWGNAIRDPQPAYSARTIANITGGTYVAGTVSLTTKTAHNVPIGGSFYVLTIRGTGDVKSLKGQWIATTGTTGTTLNFSAPGLDPTTTIYDGQVLYLVFYPANATVVSGTYDGTTGTVVLTTSAPHGYNVGDHFVLSGSGSALLDGMQQATAATTSTLTCVAIGGQAPITISAGNIYPPNVGIGVPGLSFIAGKAADRTRITGNSIGDNQPTRLLAAALAGTWGTNGYSAGNTYGSRLATMPDLSVYNPGLGGSMQGLSYDASVAAMGGNYVVTGQTTFRGNYPVPAGGLQSQGLTPGWNYASGRGEVDFFCGRAGGAPGGFNFLQVSPVVVSTGTYTAGTGAVTLTTKPPHGMLPGSSFVISGVADISRLNGTRITIAGTTGSTVNYTDTSGMHIFNPLTGGTVTPTGGSTFTITTGTYTSGTGAMTLTTSTPHGMTVGTVFVVAGATDSSGDLGRLATTQTATTGTTGTTLNFTTTGTLSISNPITTGTITPTGTAGGVIDTTVGVAGSLLANDGYGNTRFGGSLIHGALQAQTLANAGTLTVNANTSFVQVQNSSSIATGTLVLPAPASGTFGGGGNVLEIYFQNAVGTLTMTAAAGATITGAPTTIAAANSCVNFIQLGTVWTRRIMA